MMHFVSHPNQSLTLGLSKPKNLITTFLFYFLSNNWITRFTNTFCSKEILFLRIIQTWRLLNWMLSLMILFHGLENDFVYLLATTMHFRFNYKPILIVIIIIMQFANLILYTLPLFLSITPKQRDSIPIAPKKTLKSTATAKFINRVLVELRLFIIFLV